MKARFIGSLLTLSLLPGCTSVWQSKEPVQPTTYTLPDYRRDRSVGNLRRLALLPLHYKIRRGSETLALGYVEGVTHSIAAYLKEEKGYEIVVVAGERNAWREDIVKHPEFGTSARLAERWSAAGEDGPDQKLVTETGRALEVDGVITAWVEYDPGRSELRQTGWAVANIFLLNAPLFYEMAHDRFRISIRETASGRVVWRGKVSELNQPPQVTKVLENLENALPAQLTR